MSENKNWPFPKRDEKFDIIVSDECKKRQPKEPLYNRVKEEDDALL